MLALLFVFVSIVILIHIPPVQKQITRVVSSYLSSKINARVDISRIGFSIFGNATIADLAVWGPDHKNIFSVREIEVNTDIFDLITGDLNFDEIRIEGLRGQLFQREDGLNLQFIIDAFQPNKSKTTDPGVVKIQLRSIDLRDIAIEYTSILSGTTLKGSLGKFTSQDAEISTNPMKISAGKIYLENSFVNVLYKSNPDTVNQSVAPKRSDFITPDFGTGMTFDVKGVEMKDNGFSFHRDQVLTTPKFNPSHIELENINLNLSNIIIHKDTLSVVVKESFNSIPWIYINRCQHGIKTESSSIRRCLISMLYPTPMN